jgi:hypothetical protein
MDYLRHPGLITSALVPRRSLLVLSHMRSYSSLLSHILGSNPGIDGYVELHQAYTSPADLRRMRLAVARLDDKRLTGQYALDKVLHNKWVVDDSVLHRDSVYTLFSVREPEATIKSTVAMALSRKNGAENWKADVEKVGRYYQKRCDGLIAIAERKPAHSAFFVAERLIDRSDETLAMMTSYLGLETPLTSSYEKFSKTRKRGYGDPSQNIAAGEIKKDRPQHQVDVPEHVLAPAQAAYERTVHRLVELCAVSLPGDHP